MASRVRILGATILVAAVVVAAAVAWHARRGAAAQASDSAVGAAGEVAAPSRSAEPLPAEATSRIARARFTDAEDGSLPPDEDAADVDAPISDRLRRIAVTLTYDDGHPLAHAKVSVVLPGTTFGAYEFPPRDEGGLWSADAGAKLVGRSDSRGLVRLVVPRGERCALVAVPTPTVGPFGRPSDPPAALSPAFVADFDERRIVVSANALRVRFVDQDGAALGGIPATVWGDGAVPGTNHSRAFESDAEGLFVVRGFAAGATLTLEIGEGLREPAGGLPAMAKLVAADPPAQVVERFMRGEAIRAPTGAEVVVRMRSLPVVRARVLDEEGVPAVGAEMRGVATYRDGVSAPLGAVSRLDDDRMLLVVDVGVAPPSGETPTEFRCEFDADGLASAAATVSWSTLTATRFLDLGDVRLKRGPRLKVTVLDSVGEPCKFAEVAAVCGVEAPRARSSEVARATTDSLGVAVLNDEAGPVLAGFRIRSGCVSVFVDDASLARDLEGTGLVVCLPPLVSVEYALPPDACGFESDVELAWSAAGVLEAGSASARFEFDRVARFFGVPAEVAVDVAFQCCAGRYAATATTFPSSRGTVRATAPPPGVVLEIVTRGPDGSVALALRAAVFAADGGLLRRLALFDHCSSPPYEFGTWRSPCLGARPGDEVDVVAYGEGGVCGRTRVRVVAPVTRVEIAFAALRRVRARFVDRSTLKLDADRLSVEAETDRESLPASRLGGDEHSADYVADAPVDDPVRFVVEYCGVRYVRAVAADVDAVEIVAEPTGEVVARTRARPYAAALRVAAYIAATDRCAADDRRSCAPDERDWRAGPLRLPPGRYRLRAGLETRIGSGLDLGEREIDVVAGVRTVVDF